MTGYQLSPGGLYVPPSATDGPYVAHKVGTRFTEFLRLINGTKTTVTTATGTVQVDAIGTIPPGGAADQVLTKLSATDYDVVWDTPTGGGGGGGTGNDGRWTVGTGETTIDEFNDNTLDAAWARVDGTNAPAGNVTWAEGADSISALQTAADTGNGIHALLRPLSGVGGSIATGDAFITCMTLLAPPATNYSIAGLCLANGNTYGSGKQVLAEAFFDSGTPVGISNDIGSFTNFTTSTGGSEYAVQEKAPFGTSQFMRLVYLGSNQWRYDRSLNGATWILGTTVTIASLTPTHVGLFTRRPSSGTHKHIACFEFIRRVAGIT